MYSDETTIYFDSDDFSTENRELLISAELEKLTNN